MRDPRLANVRISVFGCGYLGAVHAACMAKLGHEVVGVDVIEGHIADLSAGRPPFHEPGLPELLREALDSGRLEFTTDASRAADATVHFVCVGTPQKRGENAADLAYVRAATDTIMTLVKPGDVVVGKSTVPVGTAEEIADRLAEVQPDAELVWNPEFLREGFAVKDTLHPDRLVYGFRPGDGGTRAATVLNEVYAATLADGTPKIETDLATAQLVKVAANSFLATKISFINAMAELCEATGADVTMLADAIGHDARIGRKFLNAGVGFGGGCLPKDIAALAVRADELGVHVLSELIHSVEAINTGQRNEIADLAIEQAGGDVTGKRIAVLGAAFKPGTDDTRNSPALTVADRLHEHGADVRIYDPEARLPPREGFTQVASVEQAMLGAEIVLHLTEWPEFRQLDPEKLANLVKTQIIIDGRLKLHAPTWRNAGWKVVQIGRAATM